MRALDRLWRTVGREAARTPLGHGGFAIFALGLATHLFSPYELNPLDIHPLRKLLNELVDFAALRERSPMPLLIAATQVRTGECRIFREHELTAEMVLASSLPAAAAPCDRDRGRGLLGRRLTPAIRRFWSWPSSAAAGPCSSCGSTQPTARARRSSAPAIRNRTAEIVFGRPLAIELAQLEKIRCLGRGLLGSLQPRLRRLARLDLQIIDGEETLARLDPITKLAPDSELLERLRPEGRAAAERWLRRPA